MEITAHTLNMHARRRKLKMAEAGLAGSDIVGFLPDNTHQYALFYLHILSGVLGQTLPLPFRK
jgi:hypothetical protein